MAAFHVAGDQGRLITVETRFGLHEFKHRDDGHPRYQARKTGLRPAQATGQTDLNNHEDDAYHPVAPCKKAG
jgi:hypothetical protein